MIGSAKLLGEIPSGDGFTPRGVSAQFSTLEIDGAWPNLPGKPKGYAPTSSLEVSPGSVTINGDGSCSARGRFKIDEGGFFDDPNASISYWLDTLEALEIAPLTNERPDTLIISSLTISGTESGEPYAVDFGVEYVGDQGAGRTRANLTGVIARSTFKGGRGRQEIQRFMSARS